MPSIWFFVAVILSLSTVLGVAALSYNFGGFFRFVRIAKRWTFSKDFRETARELYARWERNGEGGVPKNLRLRKVPSK